MTIKKLTIKKRLQIVETKIADEQLERHQMIQSIQCKLGLPLPEGADMNEGLCRLQDAIAANEFEQFRIWVEEPHREFGTS